jgi:glycosyltransferase involved in cell wall biosynthesis
MPRLDNDAIPQAQAPRNSTPELDLWVVIPAFNEASTIADVVSNVRSACPNVVVVDDASADKTRALALATGARVVRHPVNLGQGAALQTGIRCALGQGASYIATFDADGQHRTSDVLTMLALLKQEQADVVLGSRFLGRAVDMPLSRRWLLRTAVAVSRLTTGSKLTDAHNGLRVMTAEAASRLRIKHNRMAHASEIIGQIRELRLRVLEAPVTIQYTPYSLAKGQRAYQVLDIIKDLVAGWLSR